MLKKDYKGDKLDTLIHKMHLFLILVCIEKDWDELVLKTFEHVFDLKLDHSNSQAISNIIKSDINYIIPRTFYNKNINKYVIEGKIMTLEKNIRVLNNNTIKVFNKMAIDLLER